ncbi:DUF429 domain-containing protein [Methylobacterium sp. E-065]|uniref:ribonuclease H-like domain-containing protein n=1 Tax=Methylobacterium sp. E-065 TaxID=2836583 RepID=UPI001FB9E635|nr:ribonuclease H-like domain-containing protein [Methylobacterium sp. E-065]MCJ2015906.1 DUF429 domain-containing protein [Methylobacterium sp. E-065]
METHDGQSSFWTDLPRTEKAAPRLSAARNAAARELAAIPLELSAAVRNPDGVLFLDVETTGLSRYYDVLTVVGYQTADRHRVFIAGDDPAELLNALAGAEVLVTFNGKMFDVPFLLKTFGTVQLPPHHLDLRFAARRIGLAGGQKAIEIELGLRLREGFERSDGAMAVILWHRYLRGDLDALRRLLVYNEADVRGMTAILDHIVSRTGVGDDLLGEIPVFSNRNPTPSDYSAASFTPPLPDRLARRSPRFDELFCDAVGATVIGIDLTGSEAKPSGFAVLRGRDVATSLIATDDDLVDAVLASSATLVSIDSPLSLPRGRTVPWDDDPARNEFGIMRICERTLKRRGINVYPCLLPSMQKLTARGMRLAGRLRGLGVPVIESYPGAAQDIMGIPRKGAGKEWLAVGLSEFGLRGPFADGQVSHDELDAVTSALVGVFFLEGRYEALDGPDENALIVPSLEAKPGGPIVALSGPISAGKTTVARMLEAKGFQYARFSMVLDDLLEERGIHPDRVSRQAIGMEIHETKGQSWLCDRIVERLEGADMAVIDGLRWPEDMVHLFERYGNRLLHIRVEASEAIRAKRYAAEPDQGRSLVEAEAQPVERAVEELGRLASVTLTNESGMDALEREVARLVEAYAAKIGETCQFPSS